jgi:hypothetical protein
MVREIPVAGGLVALVDDEDEGLVRAYEWRKLLGPYTAYAISRPSLRRSQKAIFMHRLILGASDGVEVDHKDLDGLNNTRKNIRLCSCGQNKANIPKYRRTAHGTLPSSRFKGVRWKKEQGFWAAQVRVNGQATHLGYFRDEVEAARAYNVAALAAWGQFARLNDV